MKSSPRSDAQAQDCVFCGLGNGTRPIPHLLYEDDRVFAMLDQDWVVKGHALIVWREHRTDVSDLTPEEYLHFSAVFHNVEGALKAALDADRAVVLKSGGLVPHFHFHSYPLSAAVTLDLLVDLIAKRTRHEPAPGEPEQLITDVRQHLR